MSEADTRFRNRVPAEGSADTARREAIVPPALTSSEWTDAAASRYRHDAPALGPGTPSETLHYAVAMANALLPDGDPRKFTAVDVAALWLAANALTGTMHGATCAAVAAKLAAIVPPSGGHEPEPGRA